MFQYLAASVNSDPTFCPFRNKQTLFGLTKLWAYSSSWGRGAQALAVTTKTRSSMLPDVPTLNEAGLPGFEDETFNAILAPAGTPAPIVAKLHDAIAGTLNQPQVRERLAQQGIEAKASASPAAFRSYLQAYLEKYRRIAAGIHGK